MAMPSDVRKVFDLPQAFEQVWGYAPVSGRSPKYQEALVPVGRSRHRTSDGEAVVPQPALASIRKK